MRTIGRYAAPFQILLLVLVLASACYSSSAEAGTVKELYLFREMRVSQDQPDPGRVETSLYRVIGNQISQEEGLPEPQDSTRFVIADSEMRLVVVGGSPSMPSGFQVMSMDRPGFMLEFPVDVPGMTVASTHLVDVPAAGRLLVSWLFNDKCCSRDERLVAFEANSGRRVDVPTDAYQLMRITGGTAGYEFDDLNGCAHLRQIEGGKLVMPVSQRVFEVGLPLPPNLRFATGEYVDLYLNNSHLMAVAGASHPPSHETVYRVLDKRRNQWSRLPIPGDISRNVRAFGPWMSGMVDENLLPPPTQDPRKLPYPDVPDDPFHPPKEFRLSPGRHHPEWVPQRRTGYRLADPYETVDLYLENKNIYRPGILFLYNVETHRYYQWDNHEADSEVILVEGDQVYYRVDQKIYRAKIGEKGLAKPELIVEEPEVSGIHWAFFGPDLPGG